MKRASSGTFIFALIVCFVLPKGASATVINLAPTDGVQVAASGTPDTGGVTGSFSVRERQTDTTEGNLHVSEFFQFDVSGISTFDTSSGDSAWISLDFVSRLNNSQNAALFVGQVTDGPWSSGSPPGYSAATDSGATFGPGTQVRQATVVPNIKNSALGTYSVDVTDIVDAWINGSESNFGLGVYPGDNFQGAGFNNPQLIINQEPFGVASVALFDFQEGTNGNFNTPAFDSVDIDTRTTASRLSQSGGLTGGGANAFIVDNAFFNSSDSGSAGLNVGGVNQSSATEYISFTVTPSGGEELLYTDMSLFVNAFSGQDATVELRVLDGAGPETSLGTFSFTGSNQPVIPVDFDFTDFLSTNVTEWRLYPFGTDDANHGFRFDDISLQILRTQAEAIPEPASIALWSILGLGLTCFGVYRRRRK